MNALTKRERVIKNMLEVRNLEPINKVERHAVETASDINIYRSFLATV